MELVYLWIEEYGCFKNTGFHFNNDFNFEYDKKTNHLTISDLATKSMNPVLYEGNITNVSVIVGDNGAGKTSLLRSITDFMATHEECKYDGVFVGVFYDPKVGLSVFSSKTSRLNINLEKCKVVPVGIMDINSCWEMMKQTKLIYTNNMLELTDYTSREYGHLMDASVGGLLRTDFIRNKEDGHISISENPILNYFNSEIYRQLKFLYGYKPQKSNEITPFKLPNALKVTSLRSENRLKDVIANLEQYNAAQYESENLTPNKEKENKRISNLVNMINQPELRWKVEGIEKRQQWLFSLVEHLFLNTLVELGKGNTTTDERIQQLNYFLDAYVPYERDENPFLYFRKYFNRVKEKLDQSSIYSERLDSYIDFLKWLNNDNFFRFDLNVRKSDEINIKLIEINEERFKEFFNHYNKTCQPYYYLNFSWGLSTGENNFLSLYARLYSALEIENEKGQKHRNILLLIDEADLSFHPKWQIEYMDVLLKMVGDLFKEYQVQVILTTHSPILLSDVPKSNVIYLKQGVNDSSNNHQETFGQNIHTLFTDAFFLDKATGRFSNKIIQRVKDDLDWIVEVAQQSKDYEEMMRRIEDCKSIINIIGEPIVRKALEFKIQEVEEAYQTESLKEAINLYNDLSSEDRDHLIQYIINVSEKDMNYDKN